MNTTNLTSDQVPVPAPATVTASWEDVHPRPQLIVLAVIVLSATGIFLLYSVVCFVKELSKRCKIRHNPSAIMEKIHKEGLFQ